MKFKDYPPTDHELFEISRFITEKWEEVGFTLHLTSHQINGIINNSRNDKAHLMLMEWRNSTDSSSPYEDLYNALCDPKVKRKKVAKGFCLMGIS